MYTSESGAKYRKAREPRSRSYPDTDKLYEEARKSVGGKVNGEKSTPTRTKALEKGKKKAFYTRADGTHETKKEYQLRHGADLSKYENN